MEQIVEKYIALRDMKTLMKGKYEAKIAKLDQIMDKIEGVILTQFNEQGMTACTTKAGTAYKQLRVSAGVGDWDTTLEFIQANDLWNFLEHRVSKVAVNEYKEAHAGEIPPGINWREEYVINVRRTT
jgi:hypothetical protein